MFSDVSQLAQYAKGLSLNLTNGRTPTGTQFCSVAFL